MRRPKFMNPLITAALGATLAWGPGIAVAQQTSPNQSNSSQQKQDVPEEKPEKSPNLKPQRSPTPPSPGTGNTEGSQSVPHHPPDSKNPDLQQQNKPAPKKKTKPSKGAAPSSSQPSGTPRV